MPIAIQNRGFTKGPAAAPLVVTPNNEWDWTLSKMAMNSVELVRLAADHFIQTHLTLGPITTSQYRMLAASHPVYVMFDTVLQYNNGNNAFGLGVLTVPIYGVFDDITPISGAGVIQTMVADYATWSFYDFNPHNDLKARKLGGIPNFSWFKQATALYDAIGTLASDLVNVYYSDDAAVQADFELQGFAKDVVTNGKVAGFPSSFTTRASLAKAIAHVIYLTSVRHHSMNTYTQGYMSVLPWSPGALYKPLPTKLGTVTAANIASWLPDVRRTMSQVADASSFQMPVPVGQTLYWIFNSTAIHSPRTQCVLDAFRASLDPIVSTVEASAAADKVVTGWDLMSPFRLPARVENRTSWSDQSFHAFAAMKVDEFDVSVNIVGVGQSPEHPYEGPQDDGVIRGHVESVLERNYTISVHHRETSSLSDRNARVCRVYVDGKIVCSGTFRRKGEKHTFEGIRVGSNMIQKFLFSRPILVEGEDGKPQPSVDGVGSIEFRFYRVICEAIMPYNGANVGASAPVLNERSKKGAMLSSTTGFGPTEVSAATNCAEVKFLTTEPYMKAILFYNTRGQRVWLASYMEVLIFFSKEVLELEGIAPPPEPVVPPTPVQTTRPAKTVKTESGRQKAARRDKPNVIVLDDSDDEAEAVKKEKKPWHGMVVDLID
ncbi:hypothetical protein HK101_002751 [Irineochytrium annulatum]|nr:hypothetical protein HK101_002751 [Irineochytrium annulatum]